MQRTVELLFAADEFSPTSSSSSRPLPREPFSIDDSATSLRRPPSEARRPSANGRRPRAGVGGVGSTGLGLWSLISWPFNIVYGVVTGTWYFISELKRAGSPKAANKPRQSGLSYPCPFFRVYHVSSSLHRDHQHLHKLKLAQIPLPPPFRSSEISSCSQATLQPRALYQTSI